MRLEPDLVLAAAGLIDSNADSLGQHARGSAPVISDPGVSGALSSAWSACSGHVDAVAHRLSADAAQARHAVAVYRHVDALLAARAGSARDRLAE